MSKFSKARKVMGKAMKDSDLRDGYRANIAMCIYDNRRADGRLNHNDCNKVAEKIIKLVWGACDDQQAVETILERTDQKEIPVSVEDL